MSDFCFYRQELPSGGNVLFFKYVPGPPRLLKESYRLRRLLPAPETVREVRVIASKKDRARALEQLARVWLPLCTPAAGPRPAKRGFQCAACWQAWSLKKKIYRVQVEGKEPFIKPATSGAIQIPETIKQIPTSIWRIIKEWGPGIVETPWKIIKRFFLDVLSKGEIEQVGEIADTVENQLVRNNAEVATEAARIINAVTNSQEQVEELNKQFINLAKSYRKYYHISILIHVFIFLNLVNINQEGKLSVTKFYKLIWTVASGLIELIRNPPSDGKKN